MSEMTLAQLRALAEAEDQQEASANAESELEVEHSEEVVEDEEAQEVETTGEDESDPAEEGEKSDEDEETEEWAKPAKGAVPVEKHVEMKHKLKARIQAEADEVARLKAENEALRKGVVSQPQDVAAPRKPMLSDEDIGYDEEKYAEKMAEYTEQMIDYKLTQRQSVETKNAQQAQFEQRIKSAVDQHYERASELVTSGKVTEDNYKAADHIVRKSIEGALPGMGELVTDSLIANLGAGSEKVIYHLGVNPAALSKLTELFKSDPTGFAASIFMGELKAKFNSASIEKPSKTIKPDNVLTSTAKTSGSALSKYRAAEKAGDVSGMIAAKRLAKENKIDTSTW